MTITATDLIKAIVSAYINIDYTNVELDRIQAALMAGDHMDYYFGGKDMIYIHTEGGSDDGRIAVIDEAYDIVTNWIKEGLVTFTQAVISDAVKNGGNVGGVVAQLKSQCLECEVLCINEPGQGFTGYGYGEYGSAIYEFFKGLDQELIVSEMKGGVFSVTMAQSNSGSILYRFGSGSDSGTACTLEQMLGDLSWYEDAWILEEGGDGLFVHKG